MSIILRVGAVKPNSGQESRYGSGDEASSSYTDGDVLDIPLPEHTYQRPLPSNTQAQNNHGCFGLPYQDHNYGLPPPPSPPRAATPDPPSPLQVNGVVQMEEEVKTTPLVSVVEEVVEDSITRCICGYLHDDGYMICCDKCSVWQHIDCMGVDRNNIPDSYFCELCQPRVLDAVQAKAIQKRKREELAARNVLSDSSATDTDPEEAANALASMGKKLPANRKKGFKQKRSKMKEKALKFRVTKATIQKKARKTGKKEKENIKTAKPKKVFRTASQKMKALKKTRPLLTLEQLSSDVWNSSLSPWVDSYDYAVENQYSHGVRELSCNPQVISESVDISSMLPQDKMDRLAAVADVKKNRKGLKATEKIPAGQVIIEYKGKVKLRQDYDQELALLNSMKKLQPFVLLYSKLDTELCIDARTFGNEARFVRRSCTPNSEVRHIFSQGKLYFVIVSTKDIISGAEITVPFDYNYQNCSFCVECACVRNNCAISRFWKKLKNSQKLAAKELSMKQKKQSSGEGVGGKKSLNDGVKSNSPTKASSSPVKALQMKLTSSSPVKMSSPVKFSNVSTLLAASALLDGQLDIPDSLKLEVADSTPISPPPAASQPVTKSAAQTRRSSKVAEVAIKEEKPAPVNLNLSTTVKEKLKAKESKVKEKESKDHVYHHAEVKKERRPSSRRQSQDELEEEESSDCHSTAANLQQQSSVDESAESRKKMTREERKLDAIMKAFEKMEKRQEKKKEAMARGDVHPKKGPSDGKSKKKEGSSTENNTHSISQDEVMEETEEVKVEVTTEHPDKSPEREQEPVKEEHSAGSSEDPSSTAAVSAETMSVTPALCIPEETKSIKDDSPQKPIRKSGKRKRRRSRVQSTTVLSDVTSLSTDETLALSSIVPSPSLSVPSTPNILTVQSPVPSTELEDSEFKYKTKKHRFSEWSHRHEDESSKEEEMFVQCLPSPHVNAMDHLKRRNSHSSSSLKGTESSVGSAKKRWLRQAMHEVPAPEVYNHSLSVSTDSGSASPIHGNASPNPGISLGSPGAGSPVDFVTPLKKRRLMRESLSRETNGTVTSPSAGILVENISANAVNVTQRTNGVKQIFPAHRHSTDDRMLLHKNYPHRNGFTESVTLPDVDGASTVTSPQSRFLINSPAGQEQQLHEHSLEGLAKIPEARSEVFHSPLSNGFSEAPSVASSFISSRKLPLKFRNVFEKMEVDSSEETIHRRTTNGNPIRIEDNGIRAVNSFFSVRTSTKSEDECGIDSSASACLTVNSSAVYNGASSLMEEGSEAGCVTTKSIMNDDSPATVRVDLNAHDMEPSSLSNTPVAAFRERLFSPDVDRLSTDQDTQSDCQVNSSEDVVETASLMVRARVFDSCDICTDSASANVQVGGVSEGGGERENEVLTNEMEIEVADSSQQAARAGERNSSGAVDSSQQENKEEVGEFQVEEGDNALTSEVSVLHSESSSRLDSEGISSSCQSTEELDEPKVNVVCDSAEEAAESAEIRHSEVDSIDAEAAHLQEEGLDSINTETAALRVCDSAGNSTDFITPENHSEIVDCGVSESFRPEEETFFHRGVESNADSTSSETSKIGLHSSVGTESASRFSFCDSNYDRQRCKDISEGPSAGEESTEGIGVSSSVVDSQAGNSSDWLREEPDTHPQSEYAVSTANEQSRYEPHNSALSGSQEIASPADSSETNCLVSMASSSSSSSSRSALISSTASSTSILSSSQSQLPQHPSSTLPSSSPSSSGNLEDVQSPSTSSAVTSPNSGHNPVISPPPVSSTASPSTSEAIPAAKKKVSLLEYRKRLKEKPLSSGSEVASPTSSSRQTKTFLPSQPVMLSSSSLAFLSSTSKSSSSSTQSHRKNKMPTLATLPLFKSADGKKEKKTKPKPEKQLSLSERLRLEFGLEDCGEDTNKRKAGEEPGSSTSNDCSQNNTVPPPPPPGASYPYSNQAAGNVRGGPPGFSVSSTHGHSGFQGSSAPIVNGSQGSALSYTQQQPNISSSNLKGPSSMSGSRDRSSMAFSPAAGGQSSRHMHTSAPPPAAAPFSHHQPLQQPSSSSPSSSSQGTLLGAPPHAQSWASSTVLSTPPPGTHHGPPPPPPPPPPLSYEYNHRASHASGSVVPDDRPPPPPPLPPPPLQQTPSSSSLHRHHHHYHSSSSSKSKSNSKAAASSHYSHSSRY